MGRGLRRRLNDGLREGGLGLSIDDHLETDVGTKARFGGCMGQTEGWDMTKGGLLPQTLINENEIEKLTHRKSHRKRLKFPGCDLMTFEDL